MKNKILILGYNFPGSLESIYCQAFRNLGQSCDFLDLKTGVPDVGGQFLRRLFYNRFTSPVIFYRMRNYVDAFLEGNRNKYSLIAVFKGMEFPLQSLIKWRNSQGGSKWININPDDPFSHETSSSNDNVRDSARFFDYYFIWSRQLVTRLVAYGCSNVEYLPFAYDVASHWQKESGTLKEESDVMFFGSWDKEREDLLNCISSYKLKIYGPNWNRLESSSPLRKSVSISHISGKELCKAVSSAKIALNMLRPQNLGSHNMRTFEIPAAAGVMLTTRSQEQEEFFPEGKASMMYSSGSELQSAVARLLSDAELRAKLRTNAHQLVVPHTYGSRAKRVLEAVGMA